MIRRVRSLLLSATLILLAAGATAGTGARTLPPGLDGGLLRALERTAAAPGKEATVPVFVHGRPADAALRDLGVRVRTRAGDVLTADAPLGSLVRLARLPGVRGLQAARTVTPLLDVSVPETGADGLRNRAGDDFTGLTGEGVVVGIVDSGVDVTHPDFRDGTGATRILWYWNQADGTGPGPVEIETPYGTEWTAQQIDDGLADVADTRGHGTHVAGIAAGDGSAAEGDEPSWRFVGMAPEAVLVVVQVDLFDDRVLDAVHYVFAKARALGLPAVVNLSLGNQSGPRDGHTALDLGIDALTGPGELIVAAAGNAGDDALHAELVVPAAGADSAVVEVVRRSVPPGAPVRFFALDAYYYRPAAVSVTVVTPQGKRFGPYAPGEGMVDEATGEGTLSFTHAEFPSGDNREIQMDVSDLPPGDDPPAAGTWKLVFANPGGSPAEVDLWWAGSRDYVVAWEERILDPTEEIMTPGTARDVITVGAYNVKRCWESVNGEASGEDPCASFGPDFPPDAADPGRVSPFSSRGPTRDGREKPELVAPGLVVTAAYSAQTVPGLDVPPDVNEFLHPDLRHMTRAGTSMSTPHVTGALALALQVDPGLDPGRARELLTATARTDAFTGEGWDPAYGHGKLDAAALVDWVPVSAIPLRLAAVPRGVAIAWTNPAGDGHLLLRLERACGEGPNTVLDESREPGPRQVVDAGARAGCVYRLLGVRRDGAMELLGEAVWNGGGPAALLGTPRPNPFRGSIRVPVAAGSLRDAELRVLDVRGRTLRTLQLPAGEGLATWDGRIDGGAEAPAGIYWIHLRAGGVLAVRRLVKLP